MVGGLKDGCFSGKGSILGWGDGCWEMGNGWRVPTEALLVSWEREDPQHDIVGGNTRRAAMLRPKGATSDYGNFPVFVPSLYSTKYSA
jgi:hypothetical protein